MSDSSRRDSTFPLFGAVPASPGGMEYERIVDRLLSLDGSSRQVLVTSPGRGDGKSVTAVNLAYAFHVRGIPVLLVELSFERPMFKKVFGPAPIPFGVEDALALGVSLDSVVCERSDGLKVALASGARHRGADLVAGPALERTLLEARSSYEWTILDGPSVEETEDMAALAAAVGLSLVVVRARETESKALLKAITRIDHPQTLVVLNDVSAPAA